MSNTNILWKNNPYETNARYSLSCLSLPISPMHITRYKIIIHTKPGLRHTTMKMSTSTSGYKERFKFISATFCFWKKTCFLRNKQLWCRRCLMQRMISFWWVIYFYLLVLLWHKLVHIHLLNFSQTIMPD